MGQSCQTRPIREEEDSLKKPCCMLVVQETATSRLAAASLMTKYDQNLRIE